MKIAETVVVKEPTKKKTKKKERAERPKVSHRTKEYWRQRKEFGK